MRPYVSALAGLGIVMATVPATATIVIYDSPGAVQLRGNAVFRDDKPFSGVNAFTATEPSGTKGSLTGDEALAARSSREPRVEAADDLVTGASATSVTLSFFDKLGYVFSDTYVIGSGQDFFSAEERDYQFIGNVGFERHRDVDDVRQFRSGGNAAAVPELESWLMLGAGFGLVGAVSRRRNVLTVTSA